MIKRKSQATASCGIFLLLVLGFPMAAFSTPDTIDPRIRPEITLSIDSSNKKLDDAFSASIDYIYDFLVVGPRQYPVTEVERRITMFRDYGLQAIPSLWGSYHGKPSPTANGYRENFCLRDVTHQAEGAIFLSLNEENHTMLERFAADALKPKRIDINANDFDPVNPDATARNKSFLEKNWALWSYNFYGFPYYMDSGYQELPAPFNLLQKIYLLYQHTGDPRWLSETFMDYGRMMHNQFMETYDFNGNGVADNRGRVGTLPTYYEFEADSHLNTEDFIYDQSGYPAILTIKKNYFRRIGVQDMLLKVRFQNGKDDYIKIRINNLTTPGGIRPRLNHDYILMNSRYDIDTIRDLPVIMNMPSGVVLSSIYDGAKALIAGLDYIVTGDMVTISEAYFRQIKANKSADIKSSFGFLFSDGKREDIVVELTTRTPEDILERDSVTMEWSQLNDIVLRVNLADTGGSRDLYRIENDMRRIVEAGDTLGVQYQSLLAFSGMLAAKAELTPKQSSDLIKEAEIYAQKAQNLLQFFRENYYSHTENTYARAYDGYGKPIFGWGNENSYFMALNNLLESGAKADAYLDFIHETVLDRGLNEEAITYFPEVFYNYGKNTKAWYWLKRNLSRFYPEVSDEQKQQTYPEIAFTNISNIINHMMGFSPQVAAKKLATLSRLTDEVDFIQVNNIPFGQSFTDIQTYQRKINNLIDLRHQGQITSKLTNSNRSQDSILWRAQFAGEYKYLYAEGIRFNANIDYINGVAVSWIELLLKSGETRKVSTVELNSYLTGG